jgi:hypothetical protein
MNSEQADVWLDALRASFDASEQISREVVEGANEIRSELSRQWSKRSAERAKSTYSKAQGQIDAGMNDAGMNVTNAAIRFGNAYYEAVGLFLNEKSMATLSDGEIDSLLILIEGAKVEFNIMQAFVVGRKSQ